MNPPFDRDLPEAVARRMRAELVAAARPAAQPWRRTWWLAAATAAVMLAAVLAVLGRGAGHGPDVLALGPDEVSPGLRAAVGQCLRWSEQYDEGLGLHFGPADVAVAAEHGGRAEVLLLDDTGYFGCSVDGADSGGTNTGLWPLRDAMFGPVEWLALTSSRADAGDVSVAGRVSARVHRLVLEHGDGRVTPARLRHGVFGLLADEVRPEAALVAFDADGHEIARSPLFAARLAQTPACQAVPRTPQCPAAEPWAH